jgi:hypothetical protein
VKWCTPATWPTFGTHQEDRAKQGGSAPVETFGQFPKVPLPGPGGATDCHYSVDPLKEGLGHGLVKLRGDYENQIDLI